MVRKTVTIQDDVLETLEEERILENYHSFSELVSSALQLLIEKEKKEQYRKAMQEAAKDKLYLEDMQTITEEFQYADDELLK